MSDYAYCRVSSIDQNENRQMDAMAALGIPPERVYLEKQSGKNTKRPQLQMLMETVQKGDKVIVESISRFARNTRDLLELVERLTAKSVSRFARNTVDSLQTIRDLKSAGVEVFFEKDYIIQT